MTVIHGRSVASRKPTLRSHSVGAAAVPRVACSSAPKQRRAPPLHHRPQNFALSSSSLSATRARIVGATLVAPVDLEGKDGNGRANLGAAESGTAVGEDAGAPGTHTAPRQGLRAGGADAGTPAEGATEAGHEGTGQALISGVFFWVPSTLVTQIQRLAPHTERLK